MAKELSYKEILKKCLESKVSTEQQYFKFLEENLSDEQKSLITKEYVKKLSAISKKYLDKNKDDKYKLYELGHRNKEGYVDLYNLTEKNEAINVSSLEDCKLSFQNEEVITSGRVNSDFRKDLKETIELFIGEDIFEIYKINTGLRGSSRSYLDYDAKFEANISTVKIQDKQIITEDITDSIYHDDNKVFYTNEIELTVKPYYINPKLLKIAKLLRIKAKNQTLSNKVFKGFRGVDQKWIDSKINRDYDINIDVLTKNLKLLIKDSKPLSNSELDRVFKEIEGKIKNTKEIVVIIKLIEYFKIYNEKNKWITDTLDEKFKKIFIKNTNQITEDYYEKIYLPTTNNRKMEEFKEFLLKNSLNTLLASYEFLEEIKYIMALKENVISRDTRVKIVAREQNFLSTKDLSENENFQRDGIKLLKKEKDMIKSLMIETNNVIKETKKIEDITDNEVLYFISSQSAKDIIEKNNELKKVNINSKMQDTMTKSIIGVEAFNQLIERIKNNFNKYNPEKKELEFFLYKELEGLDNNNIKMGLEQLKEILIHNDRVEQLKVLSGAVSAYNKENERKRKAKVSNNIKM